MIPMVLLRRMLVSAILILAGFQLYGQTSEWTMFRGNPQLTGVSSSQLPEQMEPVWSYQFKDGIESTAAIAGNTVFAASLDGSMVALDLNTGKLKWKYQTTDEIKSSPSVHNGTVFFGDEKGFLHAVDAVTGEKKWTFQAEANIISSANFAMDRVLFGSYDQNLYCLNEADGSLLWKRETKGYVHATPAVDGENVIAAGCDGYMRIFSIKDGKEKATVNLGAYVAGSPAILEGKVFVGNFANQFLCVDIPTAKVLWRYENPTLHFPFYSSAVVTDTLVAVGGRDKLLYAFDPRSGKPLWTFPNKARIDSSPVLAGGKLYFGTLGGELFGVDAQTGKAAWQFEAGAAILASPSIAEGKMVIGTKDGTLFCFGEKAKVS